MVSSSRSSDLVESVLQCSNRWRWCVVPGRLQSCVARSCWDGVRSEREEERPVGRAASSSFVMPPFVVPLVVDAAFLVLLLFLLAA